MKSRAKALAAATAVALVVSGCDLLLNPEPSYVGDGRVTTAGANQMITDNKNFESFGDQRMLLMLNPNASNPLPAAVQPASAADAALAPQLEDAFAKFYVNNGNIDDRVTRRRNEIQDEFFAASEQRCNLFKTYISRLDSHLSFAFGSAATLLGGAGAIVTGATAARVLSGMAGITEGVGAEFQKDFFRDAATHVILPAMDNARKALKNEILALRSDPTKGTPANYTVLAAIADAIRYHGACSLNAGLAEAAKDVNTKTTIDQAKSGIDMLIDTQGKLNDLQGLVTPPSLAQGQAYAMKQVRMLVSKNKGSVLAGFLKPPIPSWDPTKGNGLDDEILATTSVGDLKTRFLDPITQAAKAK